MQLAEEAPADLRRRVLERFHRSDRYRYELRTKETRERSDLVLSFILDHGSRVRRRDLCAAFVHEGRSGRDKREGRFRDRQLQRVLDGLVAAGVVERTEVVSPSPRAKDKRKPDAYYGIRTMPSDLGVWTMGWRSRPDSLLDNVWLLVDQDLRGLEDAGVVNGDSRAGVVPFLIMGYADWSGSGREWEASALTDDELDAVERWARGLPDDLGYLRTLVLHRLEEERPGPRIL